jgi:hypothetical protein
MHYYVRLYRRDEARTVSLGPFTSAGDAWDVQRQQMETGLYSGGMVDQERAGESEVQEPASWWGR